jgi:hypothetical protein
MTMWQTLKNLVTLANARALLKKTAGDIFTNWNGDVDPARLIGYGFVMLGGLEFLGLTLYDTLRSHHFDSMSFSTGIVAISGSVMAAAGGVRWKQGSEVPMPRDVQK